MIDRDTMNYIAAELARGIEDGMKNGASHIAEALAKPRQVSHEEREYHTFRGVKIDELRAALTVLVASNTKKFNNGFDMIVGQTTAYDAATQITAWRTVRRALGMTT